jgi:hypothetical protein
MTMCRIFGFWDFPFFPKPNETPATPPGGRFRFYRLDLVRSSRGDYGPRHVN